MDEISTELTKISTWMMVTGVVKLMLLIMLIAIIGEQGNGDVGNQSYNDQ